RRAGKKGKHRKGRECRVPSHENQSVLLTFLGSAELPDHVLADFIGLVGVRGRHHDRDYNGHHKVLISMVFNIKMRTEVNIQIMANPATVIFKIDHPDSKQGCARAARIPGNILEGLYAAL